MIFYNTTKLVQISIFYYIDFFSFREQESPAEQSICQRIGFLIAKGNKTIVDSYRYFEYELMFINQYKDCTSHCIWLIYINMIIIDALWKNGQMEKENIFTVYWLSLCLRVWQQVGTLKTMDCFSLRECLVGNWFNLLISPALRWLFML